MKKLSTYMYEVKPDETITLIANIEGLAPGMIRASKSFKPAPPTPQGDPTWTFTVPNKDPEEVYNAYVEISFVQAPANAKVDITLQGDKGGGPFSIPTVTANSADKDPGFAFWLE